MKRIVVLGGNGRLGRAAALAFHNAGYEVTMMTRNGTAKDLNAKIKCVAGDALNEADVIRATRDCDFVFNGLNPIYTKWATQAVPMARNVIAAGKANEFVHLFPGNVYNYGSSMPPVIDAKTPHAADTKKGKIRVEMETLFREASKTDGLKTAILRAGDFFGGTLTGAWFDQAFTRKLDKNVFTAPGPMATPHSWAYLPDLAETFVKIAEAQEKLGLWSDFRFTGHYVTNSDFKNYIEKHLGKQLKTEFMPWRIIKLISWFNAMMGEVHEMSYLWFQPHKLVDPDLEALVGPLLHTPLDQAVQKALIDLNLLDSFTPVGDTSSPAVI